MDRLSRNLTPSEIAGGLFWVNLLLTVVAICVAFLLMAEGDEDVWLSLVFTPGIAAQVIYFMQYKYPQYAMRKPLWHYSAFLNLLFILGYLVMLFFSPKFAVGIFYPLGFFYFSLKALKLIEQP